MTQNKQILLAMFMICNTTMIFNQEQNSAPVQNNTTNVYFDPTINSQSFSQSDATTHMHQIIEFFQYFSLPNVQKKLSEIPIEQWKEITIVLIKEYKYKIAFTTVLSLYLILCYNTIKGNRLLDKETCWSAFKEEYSLEDLLEIPQQELAHELLKEIQRRYTKAQNITDFITPLITFMNDIEKEMKQIKRCIQLHTWSKKLHVASLLPFNTKHYNRAPAKLQRLAYLKNIFLTWAAEYKIGSNTTRTMLLQKKCDQLTSLGIKIRIKHYGKKIKTFLKTLFSRIPKKDNPETKHKKMSINNLF